MSTDGELLTFLNARLDEDAAVAKAAIEEYATGFADTWSFEGYAESVTDGFGGYVACGPYDGPVDEGQGRHIARFDPKRKLREITVDRLILKGMPECPVWLRSGAFCTTRVQALPQSGDSSVRKTRRLHA